MPKAISARRRAAIHTFVDSALAGLAGAVRTAFERRRTLILVPFCAIGGLVLYRVWPDEPTLALHGTVWLVLGLLAVLARGDIARMRALVLAGSCAAGFGLMPLQGQLQGTEMLIFPTYGHFQVTVERVLRDDGDSQRLLVGNIVALDPEDRVPPVRLARLALSAPVAVGPGDTLSAMMRFAPVPAPIVPGGYDAQFVSFFDGIGAYGSLFGDPVVVAGAGAGLRAPVEALRATIGDRILAVLGPRIGGIATALITGDQSRISDEDRETMALVGLAHVLAISGLHLSLVAGTVYWSSRLALSLLRPHPPGLSIKKLAAGLGIAAAFSYLVISGMGIPAIRATLMLTLVFAAVILGRRALTMRNVAIAALVVMAIDPASIFSASFQLSFAAVVALIAAFELSRRRSETRIERRQIPGAWLWRPVGSIAFTSIVAGAATALFTAYHFQQTAPLGLFGNLVAMPIVSFVMMPAALIGVLAMPLGLEDLPLSIMGASIETVLRLSAWIGATGRFYDPSPLLAPWALVILGIGMAWLAFFEGWWRLLGPALAVVLVLTLATEPRPDILVADTTQAIAIRGPDGLELVAGRSNTFATNVWSERYIEPITVDEGRADSCDEIGCVVSHDRFGLIALPTHPAAVHEDCAMAGLVIARFAVSAPCRQLTQVVDGEDMRRGGAHALYWQPGDQRFAVRPMIDDPGRPWRIPVWP